MKLFSVQVCLVACLCLFASAASADTMTFPSGVSHPGFSFSNFTMTPSTYGAIWTANLAYPSYITKNTSDGYNAFTVHTILFGTPFPEGNQRRIRSNLGHERYFGPGSGTLTLNWYGITQLIIDRPNGGSGASGDIDNIVYTPLLLVPEMDVRGNNISIADGDTSPSTADGTDFGSEYVSSGSVSQSFMISNTGTVNLNLGGSPNVSIGGTHAAEFSVTAQPASAIAVSGTSNFTLAFDPDGAGLRTATVTIANNDPDENPYTFAIQGTGVCFDPMTVTNGNDSGADSLREAIDLLCDGGTIDFAAALAGQTITLSSTLSPPGSMTIDGTAANITLSGNDLVRVFDITTGNVTIQNLTLANGYVSGFDNGGGCIRVSGAATNFTLDRSTVRDCQADGTYASSTGYGGGLLVENGSATIINSTFSNNVAQVAGGAIADYQASTITLSQSTMTGNSGTYSPHGAGALYSYDGSVTYGGNIFAANTSAVPGTESDNFYSENGGTLTSLGYNLADTTIAGATTGDLESQDFATVIKLGPLQDNGGPTYTHTIALDSLAIDAGDPACVSGTDQRGIPRPQYGGSGNICDIGAVESAEPTSVSPSTTNVTFGLVDNADLPVQVEITVTNSRSASVTLNDVSLAGIDPGEFTFSTSGGNSPCGTPPFVLAPAEQCTLQVGFDPSVGGPKAALLILLDDAAVSTPIALSGRTATLLLSANPIDFGHVDSGSFAEETIILTNNGTALLSIGNVAGSDPIEAPFSIVADTCSAQSIASGSTCDITVRYEPSTATAASAGVGLLGVVLLGGLMIPGLTRKRKTLAALLLGTMMVAGLLTACAGDAGDNGTGSFVSTFNITSDDPDTPNITVNLSGS